MKFYLHLNEKIDDIVLNEGYIGDYLFYRSVTTNGIDLESNDIVLR